MSQRTKRRSANRHADAKALRDRGIPTCSRGRITVLDRKALETRFCECNQTVDRRYAKAIPLAKPQKLVPDIERSAGAPT